LNNLALAAVLARYGIDLTPNSRERALFEIVAPREPPVPWH
jgi:hypothetical protein